MRNFLKEIKKKVLIYDGSKGVMLQKAGLKGGECPEEWNLKYPEKVRNIYRQYKEAGSDVIQTNTFQANRIALEMYSLGEKVYELNYEGARLAREVMGEDGFVAASIGPIGELFEPSGELTFDLAYETFKEQVRAVVDGGVDIINFETFTDLAQMRAALLAAKDVSNLPVICSLTFQANGRTLMGSDPYLAAAVLKSLGADMIGTNCSLGPRHMLEIARRMWEVGGIHLSIKPNAGLPQLVNGELVYQEPVEAFSALTGEFIRYGARLIGGCCGTTPEYIRSIKAAAEASEVPEEARKCGRLITSDVRVVHEDQFQGLNLGFIHAEKDRELLDELKNGNLAFVADKALDMATGDYEAVYVNVDAVKGDPGLLAKVVNAAQAYLKAPLVFETKSPAALEKALRLYKGKAGVVIGDFSDGIMQELLAAASKYGSTVIEKREII
ncbi:MAG: homocysteine S-methyltransferase family protein [Clostridiales bacterium]|nr:homocysteine S-methyltransferase family protein [Eubacteriales bacterium]MDH7564974.1 homocysteine S-methyltransferase family protein [Clostridiales bacterium]